jgi:dTDP-4-dehydrorhamnose 3,5-epimerase
MTFRDFEVETTAIEGLLVIRPKTIGDDRGVIRELFRASAYDGFDGAVPFGPWLQVNLTETVRGALRGMHGEDMTKLIGIASGAAFGAWVDGRVESPTCGTVVTRELERGTQVLVPPRVCNGFQATAEEPTQYLYCFDQEWQPVMPGVAVHPLDPALGIPWPIDPPILSEKDAAQPTLAEALRTEPV